MATQLGYKKADLEASANLLNIHVAKLQKALEKNNFAEACSSIRAMQDECSNASRVAGTLSTSAYLNDQRR